MAYVLIQRAGQATSPTQGQDAPPKPQGTRYKLISRGWQQQASQAAQAPVAPSIGDQAINTAGKGDLNMPEGQVAASTYASDMGRSLMTGIRSGIEQIAGTPGDIQQLSGSLAGWGAGKLGLSPAIQEMARLAATRAAIPMVVGDFPTSSDISNGTDKIIGGHYASQTLPGKYAKTVGEFAPNAALGPGGLVRKTAMTVAPALASEAVGQLTEGTKAEPYARAAAAIIAGGASAGLGGTAKNEILKDASATSKALQAAKNDAYLAAENGVGKQQVDIGTFQRIVRGVNMEAAKRGQGGALGEITDSFHSQSNDVAKKLTNLFKDVRAGNRPAPTYSEFENLRELLNKTVQSSKNVQGHITADGQLAQQYIRHIDDAMATTSFQDARKAYSTLRKTQRLERAISDAESRSSSADLAYKNEFRKLLRENVKTKQFKGAELEAIKQVAGNGKVSNLLEGFGRAGLTAKSVVGPAVVGAASIGTGGIAGAAIPLAATVAKHVGIRMTKNAAQRARDIVALGDKNIAPVNAKLAAEKMRRLVRRGLVVEHGSQIAGGNASAN